MYQQLFSIEIDGIAHQVPRDTTILEAARQIGIEIPTLCYLKGLAPDGSCRLCMVEAENRRGLLPACSTPCWKGMVVHTHSDKAVAARRFVLELLLQNHRTDCFSCPQNGACPLQDYCYEYGVTPTPGNGAPTEARRDASNPFFSYDASRCILCRRCERTCSQLQGRRVLSVVGRGDQMKIGLPFEHDWGQSDCESCGNCVANCPTGALTPKYAKHFRTWEVRRVRTTCPHCAVGCQLNLLVQNGRLVGAEPADGPSNHGLLCVKGRFASFPFVHSGDRLRYPLIRRDGKLERATWDEALDRIAARFQAIGREYGKDAVAGFSCSRATNEDNYLFQKMMRVAFGTNNVDNCARLCHSPSVQGLATTLGSGAMTNPIADITTDVDVILLVGSNPTEAHPVVGTQIRRAVRRGAKLIVVDPRKIDLTQNCALHLPIKPGTNVAFANGMLHVILEEGLEDRTYIQTRTEGFEALRDIVRDYTPERVGKICHINPDDLRTAALADVVLPGVSYAEKEGTFTNTERRVMRVRKAVEPLGEAWPDSDIFRAVMRRMGYPCSDESAAAVMDEIASVTPSFGGVSHKRLDAGEWLQWPCPEPERPGTAILHEGRFSRGLGLFYPVEYRPSAELPDGDYPLLLMLYHYNARSMTGRSESVNRIADHSYIELNELDAKALGIADGERVRVASRRDAIETTAAVGDRVGEGEAFMTFHFPDGNVNKLTNSVTDDLAHLPEYKVCACKVSRLE